MKWLKNNFRSIIILLIFGVFYISAIWRLYPSYLIDYDSSYQYSLLQHSWKEMFTLIPEDYSPPLYAVLLRLFCTLFGNSLSVMRMFTIVPYLGMICLALFPVKKEFGEVCGNTCALLCGFSFAFFHFSSQIRPHMLAMFFMMGVAVYAYISYFNSEKKNYFFLIIFSVLSMYTHNVAMLGTLGIYVILIGFSLVQKNWQKLKMGFVSGLVSAVVYIPWLFVVFYQYGHVKEHYWESKSTIWQILDQICLMPFFTGISEHSILSFVHNYIISLIFLLIILLFFVRLLVKNNDSKISEVQLKKIITSSHFFYKSRISKGVFLVLEIAIPVFIYIAFHLFVYPLASDRYNIILGTTVVFVLSVFASKMLNPKSKCIFNIIIAIVFVVNYSSAYYIELDSMKKDETNAMIEKIELYSNEKDIAFLHSHETTLGIMNYFYPDANHYVYDGTYTILSTYEVFKNVINIDDINNLPYSENGYFIFESLYVNQKISTVTFLKSTFNNIEIISLGTYKVSFGNYHIECDLAYVSFKDSY